MKYRTRTKICPQNVIQKHFQFFNFLELFKELKKKFLAESATMVRVNMIFGSVFIVWNLLALCRNFDGITQFEITALEPFGSKSDSMQKNSTIMLIKNNSTISP